MALCALCAATVAAFPYRDPTTPPERLTAAVPGYASPLTLVFSDEFNVVWNKNRSWTIDETVPREPDQPTKWSATYQLNTDTYGETFLMPSMVTASDGVLHLNASQGPFGGAQYLGAQLTTWNKVCYQGGYLEVSFKLPGVPGAKALGVWTAIWIMGNLARDNFPASVENVWPFTYDECQCPGPAFEYGLTQRISKCDAHGARYGLNREQGRGAPELDLLETILCERQYTDVLKAHGINKTDTCLISSLQLAPRLPGNLRPVLFQPPVDGMGHPIPCGSPSNGRTWYCDSIHYGNRSMINAAFYGMNNYDTVGAITPLSDDVYVHFHTVALDVKIGPTCAMHRGHPGKNHFITVQDDELCRNQSALTYYLDGEVVTRIHGTAFGARGGMMPREFPQEPMYILLGLKLSPDRWGALDPSVLPLDFQIDYVRLYQDLKPDEEPRLSCNPPDHPTSKWIEGHHLDYGVPPPKGTSLISAWQFGAGTLVVVGSILVVMGSHEFRALLLICEAALVGIGVGFRALVSLGVQDASGVLLSPVYLPAALPLAFLFTLLGPMSILSHSIACALAAGSMCLQLGYILHGASELPRDFAAESAPSPPPVPPFPSSFMPVSGMAPAMVLACLVPILGACCRLPQASYESFTAALLGSQAVAIGVAHFFPSCMWLDQLYLNLGFAGSSMPDHSSNVNTQSFSSEGVLLGSGATTGQGWHEVRADSALLYGSAIATVLGTAYQLLIHRRRRSFRIRSPVSIIERSLRRHHTRPKRPALPGAFGPLLDASSSSSTATNQRCDAPDGLPSVMFSASTSSGGSRPGSPRELLPEEEEMALEAELQRVLDIEPPSISVPARTAGTTRVAPGSGVWGASRGASEGQLGCTQIESLRRISAPMVAALGLQISSVELQLVHLSALLSSARRSNGGDERDLEAVAVKKVHRVLFSNYRRWCAFLGLHPRTCGLLEDCVLYMSVWGEAANLRHMPELLCWLFHQLCLHRAALVPRGVSEEPPQVICLSLLASVVRPMVEVTKWRMRGDLRVEERLTYDDLNEFFWSSSCIRWGPFAHDGERCICIALRHAPKTHMEARRGGWLHMLHVFQRPFFLTVGLTVTSCTLAYCATLATPFGLYIARLSLVLWVFSLAQLFKELLDTWAEASLSPPLSTPPPPLLQVLLTIWRVVFKMAYTSAMGVLGFSAALSSGCSAAGCGYGHSMVPTPRTQNSTWFHADASLGLGDSWPLWLAFWALGVLQLLGYTLYSRLHGTVPLIRTLCATPYRLGRIGARFYGTVQHSSRGGKAFWLFIIGGYLLMHFFLIAKPTTKGHSNFVVLRASKAASPAEFDVLILALWLPCLPTGLIVIDLIFQVAVLALGIITARCGSRSTSGRIAGWPNIAHSYRLVRERFYTNLYAGKTKRAIHNGCTSMYDREIASISTQGSTTGDGSQPANERREEGGQAAAVQDAFSETWDRIIQQLRMCDLLSNGETRALTHIRLTLPSRGEVLIAPPLFLVPSLHEALSRAGQPIGPSDCEAACASDVAVDSGVDGACAIVHWLFSLLMIDQRAQVDAAYVALRELALQGTLIWSALPPAVEAATRVTEAIEAAIASIEKGTDRRLKSIESARRGCMSPVATVHSGCAATPLLLQPRVMGAAPATPDSSACSSSRSHADAASAATMEGMQEHLPVAMQVVLEAGRLSQELLRIIPHDANSAEIREHASAAREALQRICTSLQSWVQGFHSEDELANRLRATRPCASILSWLLSQHAPQFRPRCEEARRRLKNFVSTLQMDMPAPEQVANMPSLSVLTPVYKETIIFSVEELTESGSDGRPLLGVLQSLYKHEWANMCERTGASLDTQPHQLFRGGRHEPHATEVRLWASVRGQTLARTVTGMMAYQQALVLQAYLECDRNLETSQPGGLAKEARSPISDNESGNAQATVLQVDNGGQKSDAAARATAESLVATKFEVVVACQMYGEQKRTADARATDVELLLGRFPGLRIAYVERATGGDDATYDAVLLVSGKDGAFGEASRVRLPADPILGEGKPENQNLGMTFTRGEKVAMIDMNQDGYFEEALKLRNLLREFEGGGSNSEDGRPVTIVGFPEHIFTQSSGFVTAIYMAMQERYFGTFYQRVLSHPLGARFHYGHPDILDKLHFLTRGGISSASKQINLSEDVFAGYKTVLRGGRVVFREYHQVGKGRMTNLAEISAFFAKVSQGAACQVMSRDLYRLCKSLPIDRQLSLLFGGFGFYIVTCLTMYLVYATAFLLAILNLAGLLPYFQSSAVTLTSIALWMPLVVSLVLMLPDALMVWHERGVRIGLRYFYGKIVTLAPVYYIFIAQTRAYHFANTMRWGGADYYVTRRAISISHTHLHELYMAYGRSHFYPAAELLMVLFIASSFSAPSDMFNATWMLWAISLALIYVPFLYNPNALQLTSLLADFALWREWISINGVNGNSAMRWSAWWESSTPKAAAYDTASLMGQVFMAAVYAYLAYGILLFSNTALGNNTLANLLDGVSLWQLSLGAGVVLPTMVLAAFDSRAGADARRARPMLVVLLVLLACGWFVSVTQMQELVPEQISSAGTWAGRFASTFYAVPTAVMHTIACFFIMACFCAVLTVIQTHVGGARALLKLFHRTRDYLLCASITLPLVFLALLWFPHRLQTRLVFQASSFFFSDTPRGRWWCAISSSILFTLVLGWMVYCLIWFLGYAPAPPFGVFSC